MRVGVLSRDLMLASRIVGQASANGHAAWKVDRIADLPPASTVDLLLVNWAERDVDWGSALDVWRSVGSQGGPRVIVYGPHTDLTAHAEARSAGLGPMWANSRIVSELPRLLEPAVAAEREG